MGGGKGLEWLHFLGIVTNGLIFDRKQRFRISNIGRSSWTSLELYMVEAAGIEPASVNPPRTGDYMLSLSLI